MKGRACLEYDGCYIHEEHWDSEMGVKHEYKVLTHISISLIILSLPVHFLDKKFRMRIIEVTRKYERVDHLKERLNRFLE